jgi:hypothetical protein
VSHNLTELHALADVADDMGGFGVDVVFPARKHVVEDADIVSFLDHAVCDVATNESGSPDAKYLHVFLRK